MDIRVAGHQVETGEALRTHVAERMNAMSDKYVSRTIAANVTFGRGPHDFFDCDIVAPVAQGMVLKASNRAEDAHVAFEGAATKIERQLKRYMSRLRERRGGEAQGRRQCRLHGVRAARRCRGRRIPNRRRSSPRRGSTFPRPACPTRS